MTSPAPHRYDVAFSFLAKDVHLAEQLANDLQHSRPGRSPRSKVFRAGLRVVVLMGYATEKRLDG